VRQTFLFALLAGFAASLSAQHACAQVYPTVSIVVKSTQEVEDDLKFIVTSSGAKGVAQWKNIQQLMPVFLGGIDSGKPIRVDLVFIKGAMEMRFVIPYEMPNEKALVENVVSFAGTTKAKRLKTGYYRIDGKAFKCYVRVIKAEGYAIISSNPDLVPATFKGPLVPIAPLIKADYDVGAIVKNDAKEAEARKQVMSDLREEVDGTLKKKENETAGEFELRKVALGHQIDELERLFVESDQLSLGWTTDVSKKEGRLNLELTALPETALAKSIENLAADPSLFAAVERTDNTIFFGRVNHSLDPMRQANISEILKLMRVQADVEIDKSALVKEEHREALKEAGGLIFDILVDGSKMGVIDGFANVEQTDGNRVITGGIRIADSAAALKVLETLKKTDAEVTLNAVKNEGLSLHRLKFGDNYGGPLRELLGVSELLIAFPSEDVVLFAGGGKAEDRLKTVTAAIGAAAQPENDGTFIETWAKAKPWIEILKERRLRIEKENGFDLKKLTDAEQKAWKEDVELREEAIQVFSAGHDTIHMKLQRKDQKVVGVTTLAEDFLKLVGLQIARFSEDKLE
jgi:hypothetical protein